MAAAPSFGASTCFGSVHSTPPLLCARFPSPTRVLCRYSSCGMTLTKFWLWKSCAYIMAPLHHTANWTHLRCCQSSFAKLSTVLPPPSSRRSKQACCFCLTYIHKGMAQGRSVCRCCLLALHLKPLLRLPWLHSAAAMLWDIRRPDLQQLLQDQNILVSNRL